jgi:pSer/pThr/pTyr-binding forkhead associated (FHA) protein
MKLTKYKKEKYQFFKFKGDSICIGRSSHNDIQISDKYVSRKHLQVLRKRNRYFIRDLESRNGTFINGKQIRSSTVYEVKEGITIVIGMSVICLGERSSTDVLAILDSIDSSKGFRGTSPVILKLES